MDFMQLIKERYSLRQISERPIEQDKLDLILEAGRLAPTASNRQCQRVLVINSDEAIAKLQECTIYHFNAKTVLLVCFDYEISKHNRNPLGTEENGPVDASIVATHMMLEAAELGIGSTWVGYFDTERLRTNFQIPLNYRLVCLLPLGYPADQAKPSPMHSNRFPVEKTVCFNKFPD